jgi:hypothetical protein
MLVQEIFCFALAALVGPVQYFNSFVLIVQQAGQAAVLGRLSLSVCLWLGLVPELSSTYSVLDRFVQTWPGHNL